VSPQHPDDEPTSPELPTVRCPQCRGIDSWLCTLCMGARSVTRKTALEWIERKK
jgi:hypothetical protein